MKTRGFTLIELVVVIGALGTIMIAVTAILINSFKAKARVEITSDLEQGGDTLLGAIRSNLFNTSGIGISCVTNGSDPANDLMITNITNGEVTHLVCYEGDKVASESAVNGVFSSYQLTGSGIAVSGCDNFARCETAPGNDSRIAKVNFLFYLMNASGGDTSPNSTAVRKFENSVTVRN